MKKVLHVIDHLGLGGAQTIVRDLIEKNENFRIFALRKAPNQIKFLDGDKERVKIFNGKFKYDFTSVIDLKKEIEKNDIDVIHAHLSKAIFIVYLFKLLFSSKVKVVIHEHGAVFSRKRWFYRFMLRRIQKYIICIIAVSNQIKKALIEVAKIDKNKVELVYNFIDFDELNFISENKKRALRKSLDLSEDDFLVGFAGRLSIVKRIDTLISAYSDFKDGSRTKVVIIGDGELKGELETFARGEENIRFLGFREDIKQLYQILDVIVLPSTTEASPMTFYESQVYGIPFVGSDVYAINEFIKDGFNGFLFKLGDEKELAQKIIELRDDKILRDKIKKNAINNLKKYDIKIYNAKMNDIYNRRQIL